MNDKLSSSEEKGAIEKMMYEQLEKERKGAREYIPEQVLDIHNQEQQFFKIFMKQDKSHVVMKHGHRVWRISRHDEDLCTFLSALLQFQAKYPIRIFTIDIEDQEKSSSKEEEVENPNKFCEKNMWIETQFLLSSITQNKEYEEVEKSLENKVYEFFRDQLVPKLKEFKEKRVSWEQMNEKQFTDEKVINDFQREVIMWSNEEFAKISRTK